MEIYLDHQTISRPKESVIEVMNRFFHDRWGTVLAPHQKGQELYPAIDQALKSIYHALGVSDQTHFVLTSGGLDAHLKFLLTFFLEEIHETGKNHLLASVVDEAPILLSHNRIEELGCVTKLLPVDENGRVKLDALEEACKPKTSLLTLTWANGMTGVVQPIDEIIRICREKGVKLHLDGSHAIGKIDLPLADVDYFSFDGDKIGTPQGIGGVFQKKRPKESNQNAANLNGLSKALQEKEYPIEIARLRDTFESELKLALPDCQVLFQDAQRLPNISAIAFPGVMSEALLYALHRKKLYATMGGGQAQKLSAQLKSCGMDETICQSTISFALSQETTEDQLANALDRIVSSVRQLKRLSVAL